MTDTAHENIAERELVEANPEDLVDPVEQQPDFHRLESRIALAGHPIHAMLVAFPIALTTCVLGADIFYWWTGDLFWARAGLWAAGMAFLFGVLAGGAGTVELLSVPGIRQRAASWTHFIIAVMLLSILGMNWGYRLLGYEEAVLPFGIMFLPSPWPLPGSPAGTGASSCSNIKSGFLPPGVRDLVARSAIRAQNWIVRACPARGTVW